MADYYSIEWPMGRSPLPMTKLPDIVKAYPQGYGVSIATNSVTGEIMDISLVAIPAVPAKAVPAQEEETKVVAVDLDTIRRFNF